MWNGGGTVKLVILGADFGPADLSVAEEIQEAFDPTGDGSGIGIAPIGHVVTVVPAEEETVNITCTAVLQDGYTWDDVKDSVSASVEEYFLSLRKEWEDSENLVVRAGQIENMILNIQGIDDVTGILLNGTAGNCLIDEYKIPKVGELIGQTGN